MDYVCIECGSAFSYKQTLRRHEMAVHQKIKSHVCKDCGKAFSEKFALNRHDENVHKMIKKVQCTQCKQLFTSNNYMKKHLKAVHNKVKSISNALCVTFLPPHKIIFKSTSGRFIFPLKSFHAMNVPWHSHIAIYSKTTRKVYT